jgi:hypothetical protein
MAGLTNAGGTIFLNTGRMVRASPVPATTFQPIHSNYP